MRKKAQESREGAFYKASWLERNIHRKISIHITRVLVKRKISPNQVTLTGFLITILAGVFLFFGEPPYLLIGAVLLFLGDIFDCVDGEVARYGQSESLVGAYLDELTGLIKPIYVMIALSFGIYNSLHNVTIFAFCLLIVFSIAWHYSSAYLPYHILHIKGKLTKGLLTPRERKKFVRGRFHNVEKIAVTFCDDFTFPIAILLISLINWFFPQVTISAMPAVGSFTINAGYVYLVLYGMVRLVGAVLTTVRATREGHFCSLRK